ncbi:MAG: XTP/dITP diphosphatase [Oscillospiraceae bacterium]|nr:XTP/dITP diphosphatase [Oscillospiraceae bacterium]
MEKIICATHNSGKLREIRSVLEPLGYTVVSASDAGLTDEPEETGVTFAENARIKAEAVMKATGLPALADDSGLCVRALGGEPGVYSARYGGMEDDPGRIDLLLRNISASGESNREASFICALCCLFPDGEEITAYGECKGEISDAPRGEGGFGYDPVFLLPELGATMAELTMEQKNRISHRAKALAIFAQKMKERNKWS